MKEEGKKRNNVTYKQTSQHDAHVCHAHKTALYPQCSQSNMDTQTQTSSTHTEGEKNIKITTAE